MDCDVDEALDRQSSYCFSNPLGSFGRGGKVLSADVVSSRFHVLQILPDYYQFQHRKVAKRSAYPSSYYHRTLARDPRVSTFIRALVCVSVCVCVRMSACVCVCVCMHKCI